MSSDSKASAFSYFDPKDNDNLEGHPGSSLGFGDVQNFGDEPGEDPFPFHGSGETSGEGFLNLLQQIEPENGTCLLSRLSFVTKLINTCAYSLVIRRYQPYRYHRSYLVFHSTIVDGTTDAETGARSTNTVLRVA